jgi:NAD-dependent deacetylase
LLAIGTKLSVFPVAGLVPIAKRRGARIMIVNAEPTDMDELADEIVRGSIGEMLPRMTAME